MSDTERRQHAMPSPEPISVYPQWKKQTSKSPQHRTVYKNRSQHNNAYDCHHRTEDAFLMRMSDVRLLLQDIVHLTRMSPPVTRCLSHAHVRRPSSSSGHRTLNPDVIIGKTSDDRRETKQPSPSLDNLLPPLFTALASVNIQLTPCIVRIT